MAIIQSKKDIENLKYSCKILISCINQVKKMTVPGADCGEINDFVANYIAKYNGKPSFLGHRGYKYNICISINDEVVHGLPLPGKKIPDTGLVKLDFGVIYEGMFSDSACTVVLGEVTDPQRRLAAATKEAMWAGINQVKPGVKVGDIGWAVDQSAIASGFGNVYELGGHGVGYGVWEDPFVANQGQKGKGARLFENQAICIEPMLTLGSPDVIFDETKTDGWTVRTADGSWAAHEEHLILVTKKGFEVLTDIPDSELLD